MFGAIPMVLSFDRARFETARENRSNEAAWSGCRIEFVTLQKVNTHSITQRAHQCKGGLLVILSKDFVKYITLLMYNYTQFDRK